MTALAHVAGCIPAAAISVGCRLSATWVDDVLTDSFPASDPPSWTPGMARPAPTLTMNDDGANTLEKSTERSED